MSDTNGTPAPAAAPAAHAGGTDVTALQTRIEELEREKTNLQEARAGAQRSDAAAQAALDTANAELTNAQELLQRANANLETQQTSVADTQAELEKAQQARAAAERSSKVLTLAGVLNPALVGILADGSVTIDVPGESDEDISESLKGFMGRLQSFSKPTPASEPGGDGPETPSPGVTSGPPGVPGQTGKEAEIAALKRQNAQEALKPLPSRQVMDEITVKIRELQAG